MSSPRERLEKGMAVEFVGQGKEDVFFILRFNSMEEIHAHMAEGTRRDGVEHAFAPDWGGKYQGCTDCKACRVNIDLTKPPLFLSKPTRSVLGCHFYRRICAACLVLYKEKKLPRPVCGRCGGYMPEGTHNGEETYICARCAPT